MSVDGERRDPFLAMGRQRRGQIDRPRTFGAVKAPDGLRAQRIHVDGFAAVAPAGGDGDGDADVLAAEFLFTGGRLGHAGDAGIGNHALHPGAAGVAQFLADKRGGGFRHVHGLRFQRLADPHATTIDYRTNTDLR